MLASFITLLCFLFFIYRLIMIGAIILTWVQADPYNQLVMWINRLTRPVWAWCRGWLPQPFKFLDAYVALLMVFFAEAVVVGSIQSGFQFIQGNATVFMLGRQLLGHVLVGGLIMVDSLILFLIIIMLFWFFISVANASPYNPVVQILYPLVDPLLRPVQRHMPRMNFDISPLILVFCLIAMNYFLVSPLKVFASGLSFPVRYCML